MLRNRRALLFTLLAMLLAFGATGCTREAQLKFESFIFQSMFFAYLSCGLVALAILSAILSGVGVRPRIVHHVVGFFALLAAPAGLAVMSAVVADHPDGLLAVFVTRPRAEFALGWLNVPMIAVYVGLAVNQFLRAADAAAIPAPPPPAPHVPAAGGWTPPPNHARMEP